MTNRMHGTSTFSRLLPRGSIEVAKVQGPPLVKMVSHPSGFYHKRKCVGPYDDDVVMYRHFLRQFYVTECEM